MPPDAGECYVQGVHCFVSSVFDVLYRGAVVMPGARVDSESGLAVGALTG